MIQEEFPLQLNCRFKGTPIPLAKWLFNGADLEQAPVEGLVTNRLKTNEVRLPLQKDGFFLTNFVF